MKNYINFSGWKFHNFPIQVKKEDYDDVIMLMKDKVSKFLEATLYILGTTERSPNFVPGFSDLDFVLISNNLKKDLMNVFDFNKNKFKTNYIMYHDPLILNNNLVEKFGRIMGHEKGWYHVCGKKLSLSKTINVHADFKIWEDNITHRFKEIFYPFFHKNIDVRLMIHKLNSVKYDNSKKILNKFDKNFKYSITDFVKRVKELKLKWFEKDDKQNLDEILVLIKEIINLKEEWIKSFADYVNDTYLKNKTNEIFYLKDPYYPMLFRRSKDYFKEVENIYKKYKQIICVFPPELSALLSEYSKYGGIISEHINKNLNKKSNILDDKYIEHAKERIIYYNRQANYCIKNNLGYGPLINFNLHTPPRKLKTKLNRTLKESILKIRINRVINDVGK